MIDIRRHEARAIRTFPNCYGKPGEQGGAFEWYSPTSPKEVLRVIASDGLGWDHVSVSLVDRCPTWDEMCFIKDQFWTEEECVIQFHPPKSEYVNCHPFCLHLWKKQGESIQTPPSVMVGGK
jgi:hypothetical protein